MSIALTLDRLCTAELHPIDVKGNATSFAYGEIDQVIYRPEVGDLSFITANTEDDAIDLIAEQLAARHPTKFPLASQLAEFLKNVRDQIQMDADSRFFAAHQDQE